MLMMFGLTVAATISLATVSETFIALTKNNSEDYCDRDVGDGVAVALFLTVIFLASVYLCL